MVVDGIAVEDLRLCPSVAPVSELADADARWRDFFGGGGRSLCEELAAADLLSCAVVSSGCSVTETAADVSFVFFFWPLDPDLLAFRSPPPLCSLS